jgi:hypothetical protein
VNGANDYPVCQKVDASHPSGAGGLEPSEDCGPDGVVVLAPAFGQHSQFLQRVEDLAVRNSSRIFELKLLQ